MTTVGLKEWWWNNVSPPVYIGMSRSDMPMFHMPRRALHEIPVENNHIARYNMELAEDDKLEVVGY